MLRRTLFICAIALAVMGAIVARALISGDAELEASNVALEAGDPHEAVVRARRAAGWYVPGAPHVPAAYSRMRALAESAEQHRRDDVALLAWRGIRSAVIETRWVLSPYGEELALANREISRLMAKRPNAAEPDAAVMQAHLQKLTRHEPPHVAWAFALVAAFVFAAAGVGVWAGEVGDAGGKIAWARGKMGAALTFCGVALWLLSLWRA
jgi:hypothetical protein